MELALVGRLLAACVVIGLVLACVQFVARRAMRVSLEGGGGRLIALLETTYLPGAASVHVLRIADRYYAVGRSGAGFTPICEIEADRVERHVVAATPGASLGVLSRRLWPRRS